jgi:hypothetical protein
MNTLHCIKRLGRNESVSFDDKDTYTGILAEVGADMHRMEEIALH